MTLSAKTTDSNDMKAVITAISTLVEEATFVATKDGITFRGMDPSHVALIDMSWPSSAFETYECVDDVKFGVRIDELAKIIKRTDKKDNIELGIEQDMLLVSVSSSKKYKMRLIEGSATDTPLPKIPYDSKIVLASSKFDKILGDVHVVSDYLSMCVAGTKGNFSGKGDSGEVVIDVDATDEAITEINSKEESTGTYSLEYLNPIVKAVGSSVENVTCEFSNSKPLRVEFAVAGIGRIHFYLAPRVEN